MASVGGVIRRPQKRPCGGYGDSGPLVKRAPGGAQRLALTPPATAERGEDVFGADGVARDAPRKRGEEARRALGLQELEALLDVAAPLGRSPVDQFGEPGLRGRPELPEALALVIQSRPGATHGLQHRGAMLGQQTQRLGTPEVAHHLLGLGHDLHPVRVQMQRRGLAQRVRGHRVLVPVMPDATAGRHEDGDLQRVLRGQDGQRPQPGPLLGQAGDRDHARRPIGPLRVPAGQPLRELGLKVGPVVEAAAAEETALDPADEILHGALLLSRPRPAQLGGEAVVEGDLAEDRVPDDQVALAAEDDRLGIIPDSDQRDAAEGLEGGEQRPDERFFPLVGHQADVGEAAPLQSAGEEADPLPPAAGVAHVDLSEVVLAELPGDALEADQRGDRHRPQPPHQLVDRALAAAVASLLAQPADDLPTRQRPVLGQPGLDHRRPRRGDRRPADAMLSHQRALLARGYGRLPLDPPHAGLGHAGRHRHGGLGHPHCTQDLDLMPGHGSDHPSPFWTRLSCAASGKTVTSEPPWTYQNFRKGRYQNFRNPQVPL
jgi:hypothetical protein